MDKEIVLLTKSKKRGNYCIAGVDRKTGEWIRIISEDASIQHAVSRYIRNMKMVAYLRSWILYE